MAGLIPGVPTTRPPIEAETTTPRGTPFVYDEHTDPFDVIKELLSNANRELTALRDLAGYRFVKPLGKGGMGAVALIKNEDTGDEVALKVMLPKVAVNLLDKERFLREIENTKALKHTNVIQLFAAGCSNDVFFFTMEYCAEGNIDNLMERRGGKLSLEEAMAIVLQLLEALEYSHHAEIPYVHLKDGRTVRGVGLVHRDVKPQNVFLTGPDGRFLTKLGDYGLSKAFEFAGLSGKTPTGDIGGSVRFMPQQLLNDFKYASPEVDVWAAAACFYYVLTGTFPRNFPEGQHWIHVMSTTHPVSIRDRGVSIPEKLADVIDLALDDRDELQFQTASHLKRSLVEALGGAAWRETPDTGP